jgi:hypothetical protein
MSRDCPRNQDSSRTPPKNGAPHTKTVDGATTSWCNTCQRWTKGEKEHVTARHVRRESKGRGRGRGHGAPAPAPAAPEIPPAPPIEQVPAVGGLAAFRSPYEGGSLHLHSGLFVGQLTDLDLLSQGAELELRSHEENLQSDSNAPDNDPGVCPDDFFHVPSDSLSEEQSHRLYTVANANTEDTDGSSDITSEMTPFLTRVAKARKVTGHNVESWVTSVENKLADVGFTTIQDLVGKLPTVNSRLHAAGHVRLFTRTLHTIALEGVKDISMDDESACEDYNSDRMHSFLQRVALTKGITGTSIEAWIQAVHGKLRTIGILSVRATVSSILTLNKKLFTAGLQMMHSDTIEVMALEGVNALSVEALGGIDQWYVDLHEVGPGTCERCDDTGKIGAPCNRCNTGSVYLNYHAGH